MQGPCGPEHSPDPALFRATVIGTAEKKQRTLFEVGVKRVADGQASITEQCPSLTPEVYQEQQQRIEARRQAELRSPQPDPPLMRALMRGVMKLLMKRLSIGSLLS